MEPAVGIEPTTRSLQNCCSTTELSWPSCASIVRSKGRVCQAQAVSPCFGSLWIKGQPGILKKRRLDEQSRRPVPKNYIEYAQSGLNVWKRLL
jgi:hypothetical protein